MVEILNNWDISIFSFLNSIHNSYFDSVFWIVSGKFTWIPLYLTIIVILFMKNWKQALYILLLTALLITLADQISSGLIKPLAERLRPSHNPLLAETIHIVNDYRGGRYGFVSSHAANTLGFAAFFAMVFKNRLFSYLIICWSIVVMYSRIYLGVHFPGDILGGIAVGLLSAYTVYYIYKRFTHIKWLDNACDTAFERSKINVCSLMVCANTLIIFIISVFLA